MTLVAPMLLGPEALPRGESLRWLLPIIEDDGGPKDFTGAVITWRMYDASGAPVMTEKTIGNGVSFEGANPLNGRVIVEVDESETTALVPGVHRQEWHMKDGIGDVKIFAGRVFVTPTISG